MSIYSLHTMKHMATLTEEQQNALVAVIDTWYLEHKRMILDGNLGFAKEILKREVCGYNDVTDTSDVWQWRLKSYEELKHDRED